MNRTPTEIQIFELSGNMNRYVWSLDNKVVSESDKILIKKGENWQYTIFESETIPYEKK